MVYQGEGRSCLTSIGDLGIVTTWLTDEDSILLNIGVQTLRDRWIPRTKDSCKVGKIHKKFAIEMIGRKHF